MVGFHGSPSSQQPEGCAAEQGRDREVLMVSLGPGMGRYLLEVKEGMPAPSTCTVACVHPPHHRQCPEDSSPRQGWARGGDALPEAGASRDEVAEGLRWRFPMER